MKPEILLSEAENISETIVNQRRALHRMPGTEFDLGETLAYVKKELEAMGYAPESCGRAGLVALAGGKKPGKVFLLRADMDGLPIREEADVDFASKNGRMHACGHDMHTAMLLGAARLLKEHEDEIEEGMKLLDELTAYAATFKRQTVPASELIVGLKCGGSDGLSGITANPLVGEFSDWLVAQGGTSILTEVPEMFGAETILMNRCETPQLFEQTVKMVNDFKEYFLSHGEPVGENPSPGNKKGGISTLEDKALGCTQKCGRAPVSGVLAYGDRLQVSGLNLLSAPGNDLVASTALAAAGCHIVLFTTGRGTPFGTFVPTMKVATNPTLAERKANWIDFNAGQLLMGKDMLSVRNEFIDKVLAVASGSPARNELNGYREISIFKNGVTL